MKKRDEVDEAMKLAIAAIRGILSLLLVRLAKQLLPEDGVVVAEVEEDETERLRPPFV